jgi:hypothetical protein
MFKKMLLIVSVFAFVLAFGATAAFAGDDDAGDCPLVYSEDYGIWVPGYCDGRINAFDIAQPVAIYYSYDTVQALDDDGNAYTTNVVSGIELWVIDAEGTGQLVVWAHLPEIEQAFSATADVQIAAADGVTLNYSPSTHMFWVTAPGYSFSWEAW